MLMHIYGTLKSSTDEPICRAGIATDVENKRVDKGEGENEVGDWD